ncbi:hypothetical protein IFM89_036568 [Coptis chinensis]|uniref:PHL domain-containing protein n=1 Tax=Coptis chinensis TaxID=261450 RepID=A0A835HEW9_9MAGN|nr:hypothetical protein IFM89_036568 [Coptis chinensis]
MLLHQPPPLGPHKRKKQVAFQEATVGGPPSDFQPQVIPHWRQTSGTMAMKRRSNSVPKTPAMSGVGSPCSVGTMIIPMNASSPSISAQPLADQMILERFSKIEMVTQRHKLNHKKNKIDDYPVRKPMSYSTQLLSSHLSNALINEELKDPDNPNPMSKSLIGGNTNICKTRALTFLQTKRRVQVAMQYGDIDDNDFQLVEDHMPTLPNTMIRDGYQHINNQVRPKPTASLASNTQSNDSAVPSSGMTAEIQQYPETNTVSPFFSYHVYHHFL